MDDSLLSSLAVSLGLFFLGVATTALQKMIRQLQEINISLAKVVVEVSAHEKRLVRLEEYSENRPCNHIKY